MVSNPYVEWNHQRALEEQEHIRAAVERSSRYGEIRFIVGLDCSLSRNSSLVLGAAVLFRWPELKRITDAMCAVDARVPYVPGFLAFREIPALRAALQKLTAVPDLALVDGHGIAHPRRCGLASHLGVLEDLPAIGVAKSILVGTATSNVGESVGNRAALIDGGEQIGWLVRTRLHSRPLIVSTGHRVSSQDAVEWVLRCSDGHRLPVPIAAAHQLLQEARQSF